MLENQMCPLRLPKNNLAFLRTKVTFYAYTFQEILNLYCIENAEQ